MQILHIPQNKNYLITEMKTESDRIEYKQELTPGLEKEVIAFTKQPTNNIPNR